MTPGYRLDDQRRTSRWDPVWTRFCRAPVCRLGESEDQRWLRRGEEASSRPDGTLADGNKVQDGNGVKMKSKGSKCGVCDEWVDEANCVKWNLQRLADRRPRLCAATVTARPASWIDLPWIHNLSLVRTVCCSPLHSPDIRCAGCCSASLIVRFRRPSDGIHAAGSALAHSCWVLLWCSDNLYTVPVPK